MFKTNTWGVLPSPKYMAVIADREKDNSNGSLVVVGFDDEEEAHNFCATYSSLDYEWAVIVGFKCSSGQVWSNFEG